MEPTDTFAIIVWQQEVSVRSTPPCVNVLHNSIYAMINLPFRVTCDKYFSGEQHSVATLVPMFKEPPLFAVCAAKKNLDSTYVIGDHMELKCLFLLRKYHGLSFKHFCLEVLHARYSSA